MNTTKILARWFGNLPFTVLSRRRHRAWLDLVSASEHLKRDIGMIDSISRRRRD